jgi:dihydrofolate reductase
MISLIVAFDQARGIGHQNQIPWFIPGELKWVADTTKQTTDATKRNALIMGHNTWLSLPKNRRPLPERLNIVVSRTATFDAEDVKVFRTLDSAVAFVHDSDNIETGFIFGGASIYEQAVKADWLDEMLLTIVPERYPADTFFPDTPPHFSCVDRSNTTYGSVTVARETWRNTQRTQE